MSKTLAIILNFNDPVRTDEIFKALKPYEGEDYDLHLLDNGSNKAPASTNTTLTMKQNLFYGGALNYAFKYFIKHKSKYDSMVFITNDVIVHGPSFVKTMREAMFSNPEYKLISPVMCSDNNGQMPLTMHKHMNCWGKREIRPVKYVDFETPMFHKDFILDVKSYSDDLIYGIGQDMLSGMICKDKGWKVGVIDWCNVYHGWAIACKTGKSSLDLNTYGNVSTEAMHAHFQKINRIDELHSFLEYGGTYNA